MPEKDYFLRVYKSQIVRFEGDLALALWYSALKDYTKRFKPDKHGFVRVSSEVFNNDWGYCRMKIWRLNKKLEEKGFITVDRVSRGGRSFIGFKILK